MVAAAEKPLKRGSFWRLDPPVISEDGRVKRGGMWAHQLKAWESDNEIVVFVTGYGGGKTLLGGKWAISIGLTNDGVPGAIVSPTFPMARETTIATMRELLEGKSRSLNGFHWEYKKQERTFLWSYRGRRGRSIIYSGDDPDRMKGPNLGYVWIDEPFIQPREIFDQAMARLRHPLAKKIQLLLTGTPEQLNWGWELCEGELRERHDVAVIQASSRENKATGESYIERLSSTFTEKMADAYIEGKFVNLAKGLVYYNFSPAANISAEYDQIPPGSDMYVGMDFNVNPMAFCVFYIFRGRAHVLAEVELPDSSTPAACAWLKRNFPGVLDVCPDASGVARKSATGHSDFYELEKAGFRLHKTRANPPIRDRENAMNAMLCNALGKRRLTISPRCANLRRYFLQYSHDNARKPEGEAMNHLLSALGYGIYYLFPVEGYFSAEQR